MNSSNNFPGYGFAMPGQQGQPMQGRNGMQPPMMQQGQPGAEPMPPIFSGDPSRAARDYVLALVLKLNPAFEIPPQEDFSSEELTGTFQYLLNGNLGAYMIGDFLIGTSGLVTREGFLVGVGRSYLLLYDFNTRTFTMCDAFSLKFASFPYLDATSIQRYIPRRYLIDLDRSPGVTNSSIAPAASR